jgi:hypothetical protein
MRAGQRITCLAGLVWQLFEELVPIGNVDREGLLETM